MKKITKSILLLITILFLLSPICLGNDVDFKEQIKKEDGSLFEKIIAQCIGGIAQTVFDFATGKELNVGFKDYDTLIFNSNAENDSLSPFTSELWSKTMSWYKVFAVMSGSLILIAVFILSYKIIIVGMNAARKTEAKESLMRLSFGGVAIALAPFFIRLLLFMNNSLVYLLLKAQSGSLDGSLGNGMLTSITTGNAITTALVIAMFIYLFVKLNIKFIVRQFTIIIFTIFTPIACGLWIINKNVTAASIWAGQILMNIFMQFVYCFLFLVYLTFLPSDGGWAISLIWAMMILPLADALMNCLQNLTSRIAGVDNEQMANRAMGMGTMLGFGMGAIKEQFNPSSSNRQTGSTDINSSGGIKGFVSKAKEVISPNMNLSAENDYNGNVNPIRDVIPKESNVIPTQNRNNQENISNGNTDTSKSVVGKVAKAGFNATKTYLEIGAKMAEGDFKKSPYNASSNTRKSNFQDAAYISKMNRKDNLQNTEFTNRIVNNTTQKIGDENEPKK